MSPQIEMCPRCHSALDVTMESHGGSAVFTCDRHSPPHTWDYTPPPVPPKKPTYKPGSPEGILAELGVRDVLQYCVRKGDPWLEFGIVEDRFRLEDPALYKKLIGLFSHSRRSAVRGGPETTKSPTTLSTVLAGELRRMAKDGLIAQAPERDEATGYWHFDGTVSYWGPNPSPESDDALTWAEYAAGVGLDPTTWERAGEDLWN
ncbi:MAG: hypothetical protein Q8K63_00480 [Acidimicrobiales bacterium]|nr:hypothetical protein [Acidimicrobiales bacterium]